MNSRKPAVLFGLLLSFLSGIAAAQAANDSQAKFVRDLKKIRHIIVIYQENWSFDGLYGKFPGADGLSDAKFTQVDTSGDPLSSLPQVILSVAPPKPDNRFPPANGQPALPVPPYDVTKYVAADQTTGDLIHRFYHEQLQIDGGKMDKFVEWSDNGGLVMSYIDATSLPEGKLAQEYVICDHFFHSGFGGSFFNHQILIAAAAPRWPNAPPNIPSDPHPTHLKDREATPHFFALIPPDPVNSTPP